MKHRSVAALWALAVGLGALSPSTVAAADSLASRESAISRFQMEQMLAYLRARGSAPAPISLDAFKSRTPIVDAKSVLERAGVKLIAQPASSPADQLREQAIVRTFRMMAAGPTQCCPCSAAATCDDHLFCNGAEICAGGTCASGSTPCVDGNPCTNDACTESTDTCSHTPVPPPAAVAQLNVSRSAPLSPVATLAWSAVTGASSYNIYRAASANLGGLACFQGGVTGTTQNDDGALPNKTFYFLVSSLACGESGLGNGNPSPRPPAPGCP